MIEIRKTFSPDGMLRLDYLTGVAFSRESGAHRFIISGPEAFTGTVTASFMRADGQCVIVTGSLDEDGRAVVTADEDCYLVPGRMLITVYVTDGGVKTCVYAGLATVYDDRGSGEAPSGETTRTIEEMLEEILEGVDNAQQLLDDAGELLDDVTAEGATQVAAVQAKGAEVIASIPSDYSTLTGDVSSLKSALHVSEHTVTKEITTDVTSTWESGYISNTGTKTAPHQTYDYSEKIDVLAGDIITFGENNSMRYVCAYDSNGSAVSAKGASSQTTEYTVPADIVKIAISCFKNNPDHRTIHIRRTVTVEENYVDGQINPSAFFVSTTGNDSNDGLATSTPKATINNALENGAETILMFGGVYTQTVDLTKCQHPRIRIAAYEKNKKTIIKAPDAVIADSETLVSGYTNVYSASCDKTFETNNIWIFQEGVADASTEITGAERHPLQRGYQYRCWDTKIAKTAATTLSDALAEIEEAEDYRWFLDDGTLYFSRPAAVSSGAPICWSSGTGLFSGNSRGIAIEMVGIDTKYLVVNLNRAMSANIEYCSSGNVYGNGCFTYDGVASARFAHCEAYRGFKGTNGDGFNAHGVTTGDTFAHQTYGLFIDCWGHDNRDDGVSDHERCESSVIGGLYEYNRFGGGVTPSYGSHCTCHGVYCRKNGDGGFIYVDSASEAEGGAGGQLTCYDCVAEENTIWPDRTQSGFKISGNNNRAILVNCKSIGQDYGYYIAETDSYITLIDCGALNCGHATGGHNDNVTKKNTTIVT